MSIVRRDTTNQAAGALTPETTSLSPRRRSWSPLALIVVAAVLVLSFVVALPWLLQPPFRTAIPFHPQATFSTPTVNNDVVIAVASISEATNPDHFRVNVALNGIPGMSAMMPAANNGTIRIVSGMTDALNLTVRWADADGDGRLSSRDYFTVSCPGGLPRPGSYAFYLLWAADGALLASADFATS